jgi:hypothetical protein
VQPTSVASDATTSFALARSDADFLRVSVSAGSLFFQQSVAGVRSGERIQFDPVAHRFLRISHDAAVNAIVWETSRDGNAWREGRRVATPFVLDELRVELEAGTNKFEAEPGEAVFDNVVLTR